MTRYKFAVYFFNGSNWSDRDSYFIEAENVKEAMVKAAAIRSDGPCRFCYGEDHFSVIPTEIRGALWVELSRLVGSETVNEK